MMIKPDNQLFSVKITKFIQELCKPLGHIALTNFMHDITFKNRQISMLVSDKDVFLFYYRNQIPTLCTDNSGRTLASGIYLNKILENTRKDCSILMPLMVKVARQFGQNYGKNSIHIVLRENDCQHFYSLFFDLAENDFLHWVINNGNFLSDFMDDYNIKARDIILEAKANESRIVLPTFSDFALSNKIELDDNEKNISQLKIFHKHLHMPIHLSAQQSKCLLLLIQGKSAKEIALELHLSHRTVEHYLERIRQQLGCSSNKELIAAYSDQIWKYSKTE